MVTPLYALVLPMLPSTLAVTALLSRRARRRWLVTRMQAQLFDELSSGADLSATEQLLQSHVDELPPGRLFDPRDPAADLRLLHAVAAMERLDFATVQATLERRSSHPAKAWVRARLALLRGERHVIEPRLHVRVADLLGMPLVDDTRAQLALAEGRPERALDDNPLVMPATRARALAALGRDAEALEMLSTLAPSRLDALCRAFPADPAVLLHARAQTSTPYR